MDESHRVPQWNSDLEIAAEINIRKWRQQPKKKKPGANLLGSYFIESVFIMRRWSRSGRVQRNWRSDNRSRRRERRYRRRRRDDVIMSRTNASFATCGVMHIADICIYIVVRVVSASGTAIVVRFSTVFLLLFVVNTAHRERGWEKKKVSTHYRNVRIYEYALLSQC